MVSEKPPSPDGVGYSLTFIVQFIYFSITGQYLELLGIFGAHEVSRWSSSKAFTVLDVRIPRFTGFFNEPGTYSGIVAIAAAARFSIVRRIDLTSGLALATLVGTASLTGAVGATLFVAAMLWEPLAMRTSGIVKVAILLIGLPVLAYCKRHAVPLVP